MSEVRSVVECIRRRSLPFCDGCKSCSSTVSKEHKTSRLSLTQFPFASNKLRSANTQNGQYNLILPLASSAPLRKTPQALDKMTASIGKLSTPIIAAIVVGGIFVVLALITITAYLCDLPARMRKAKALKASGQKPSIMSDDADMEKGEVTVSVTEVNSQMSQISKSSQSTLGTRTTSPEVMCQCEHPQPIPNRMPSFPKSAVPRV